MTVIKANSKLNRSIWKTIITVVSAQLLLICVGFVDNVMITHYDAEQIHFEAVGIGTELWYFYQAFFLCLGIVFGVLYSQFRKNNENFSETLKFSIHVSIVVIIFTSLMMYFLAEPIVHIFYNQPSLDHYSSHDSVLLAENLSVKYIRIIAAGNVFATISYMILLPMLSVGKTKYSLIVAGVSLVSNLILDYILIYVADLGSDGAAWATVISYFIQMVFSIMFAWMNKEMYRIKTKLFSLDKRIVKMVLKRWFIFVSSIIMYSSYSTVTILLVAMYGSSSIRALSIAYMISGIMWTALPAIRQTTNIFVGERLGKDDFKSLKPMLRRLSFNFMILNIIVTLVGFSMAWWVPNVMLNHGEVVDKAKYAIMIFAVANTIYLTQTYFSAILEAGGRQLIPNIFNYFAPFITAIPCILAFGPWGAGVNFEWVFAIENASIGLTVIVLWWEVKRKKWIVNLNKVAEEEQNETIKNA